MNEWQEKQCKEELIRLINTFGAKRLTSMIGSVNSRGTLRTWLARGRISATAAHELCKLQEVKRAGFSRQGLRPDVSIWWKGADE